MIRAVFLGLCIFGVFALLLGLFFEFSRSRSQNRLITKRQLRWRMLSGFLWIFIFASFAYATFFLWPEGAPRSTQLRFAQIFSGGLALMVPGFVLVIVDLRFTFAAQRMRQRQFDRNLEQMAREELKKHKSQEPPE